MSQQNLRDVNGNSKFKEVLNVASLRARLQDQPVQFYMLETEGKMKQQTEHCANDKTFDHRQQTRATFASHYSP